LGRWSSVDPLAEKYYGISTYAYCANNPIKFIDTDGRKIIPSKDFLNSDFGKTYSNLRKNNSAFNVVIGRYQNSTKFNLYLGVDAGETGGTTSSTRYLSRDYQSVDAAEVLSLYPISRTPFLKDNRKYSELGMVVILAHESIHQRIASVDVRQEDFTHNLFNRYIQAFRDILTEYIEDNNLGLTKTQIYELGLFGQSGRKDSETLKLYLSGLAKQNETTYEQEKRAYIERMSRLVFENE